MSQYINKLLSFRPTRFQVILFTTIGTPLSFYTYDRRRVREIKDANIQKVQHLSAQPMEIHQKPRSIVLFISANTETEGQRTRDAFDKHVKYIWDAAALDYEVVECWQWYDDGVKKVKEKYHERMKELLKWKEAGSDVWQYQLNEIKERLKSEGGDGFIALGRGSFKAVAVGMRDIINEIQNDLSLQERAPSQANNSNGWFGAMWPSSTNNNGDSETNNAESLTAPDESDLVLVDPEVPLPPVGYIPFTVPYWFNRVLAFFNNRWYAETIGDAAVRIALGHHVPMSRIFPGTLDFVIEEKELKKEDSKADADDKEAEPEIPQDIGRVDELYVEKLEMYCEEN
ncbi:hypothetical protein MP638_001493 [Amoeboaphelidium occidentale]|nr:hypothetical protein MP638_001493 [Amoeboaphelidium occidentale]